MRTGVRLATGPWARSRAHLWELVIAGLGIFSTLSYFLVPAALRGSPVSELMGSWAYVWSGIYGLAGLAMMVGIFTVRPFVHRLGLILFAGGTAFNLIAILAVFGAAALFVVFPQFAVCIACVVEIRMIRRKQLPVIMEAAPEMEPEERRG